MLDNLIEYGPNASASGKTLYARIANAAAQWWNGTGFEVYTAGHYATYAVAMAEQTGSGYFTVATPSALPAGTYSVVIQLQAGGTPAPTDTSPSGAGSCGFHAYWDGTAWHAGPAYADALPSPAPSGYGPGGGAGTTAVTDLAGGSARNPSNMTVTNSSSQPILGAIVEAYLASAYTANPATAAAQAETTTDVNGHWTLNLVTGTGPITLVVSYPGDQTLILPSAVTV